MVLTTWERKDAMLVSLFWVSRNRLPYRTLRFVLYVRTASQGRDLPLTGRAGNLLFLTPVRVLGAGGGGKCVALQTLSCEDVVGSPLFPKLERWAAVWVTLLGAHTAGSGNTVQMGDAFVFPDRTRLEGALTSTCPRNAGRAVLSPCAVCKRPGPVSAWHSLGGEGWRRGFCCR